MQQQKYEKIFMDELEKYFNQPENRFPNILLLGKSGAGKSSLVNKVFGMDIAKVSDFKPETKEFKKYEGNKYNKSVNIIDSEGYEIASNIDISRRQGTPKTTSYNEFCSKLKGYINSKIKLKERINVVWFCISVAGNRIEDMDLSLLEYVYNMEELDKNVCVVLTKCDEDDDEGSCAKAFKDIIRNQPNSIFKNIKIFEVSTDDDTNTTIEDEGIDGIRSLIEVSASMINDEEIMDNFIKEQTMNLELKRKRANQLIASAVAASAAVGATPIPFADAAILVPGQLAMIAQITNIYGINYGDTVAKGLVSQLVVTQVGKSAVSQLTKLIPGLGSAINAGVASTITGSLGFAISEICYKTSKKIINGENIDTNLIFDEDEIKSLFAHYMTIKNNKK